MKRLFVFLLIILASMLYGGRESNMSSIERVFSVSSNQVPFLTIPADQFSEDILARQEDSLYYFSGGPDSAHGLPGGGTFEYGVRFTDTELDPFAGWEIIAIFFHSWDGSSPNGQVIIYDEGSATNPGSQLTTEAYSGASSAGFYRCDLSTHVPLNGNERWCTVEATHPAGGYPASCDSGPAVPLKGNWWSGGYYVDANWIMGAIVEGPGIEELTPGEEAINFGFAPMINPVKGNVTVSYTTTLPGHVSIKVFDRTGLLVKTLVNDVQPAGTRTVNWNTTGIPNGVYFVRLEAEARVAMHKIIVIR